MKNTFGTNISLTIFGESHGESVGFVLDGLPAGVPFDEERIAQLLALRRPFGDVSTNRVEKDGFIVQSGVFNGYTTGTPLCLTIKNADVRSEDYSENVCIARPSHADYSAHCKYNGYEDYRGGGHFSGRITAVLVAAGGILIPMLEKKGIFIGSHIKRINGINDRDFIDIKSDIDMLSEMKFPVLDREAGDLMQKKILEAKNEGDSVGGIVETAVLGIDGGVGEPWFDSVEGVLSHALFSVPGVKGVEFGAGFDFGDMHGSVANDSFAICNEKIITATNNSGGINGGITNGMPIVFRCAFRPTPTISKEQHSVDYVNFENVTVAGKGRHDPCIVHRARIVVDCVTALVVSDLLSTRYGTEWFLK